MDYFDEIKFEQEKARLLKKYNCKTLKEVILILKKMIQDQESQ